MEHPAAAVVVAVAVVAAAAVGVVVVVGVVAAAAGLQREPPLWLVADPFGDWPYGGPAAAAAAAAAASQLVCRRFNESTNMKLKYIKQNTPWVHHLLL